MSSRYQVEFLGGPLDGHVQWISLPVEELSASAQFPINRNLFRLLSRRPGGKQHPITSVASYRLLSAPTGLRYYFQGAVAPITEDSPSHK